MEWSPCHGCGDDDDDGALDTLQDMKDKNQSFTQKLFSHMSSHHDKTSEPHIHAPVGFQLSTSARKHGQARPKKNMPHIYTHRSIFIPSG